jgi:hypothetical protein
MLALLNDSTLISKQNFLKCYKLAQINALITLNYKQEWLALRLWPVRMSKPLINRLLLKNSNKPDDTTPETLREVLVPK